jgi:rhodanese-related sulfurtransferase
MSSIISCEKVAALVASDSLFALFDVRERGEYNDCQIPFATSLPRSQIEFRIRELVPDPRVLIAVYDDDGARAERAANRLEQLGYLQVAILAGGLAAWRAAGRESVSGVNVPSKGFGEKVHHDRDVPDLAPEELKQLIDSKQELVILDVRTPEEYGRFCIPGGLNVPGGDLILWAEALKQKPMVIVNCAGRTRSIIGTAALRRLGLTNVRALRNGTMGWVLAGLELENQPQRRGLIADEGSRRAARAHALKLAAEEQISWLSASEVEVLSRQSDAMRYLIDVRSEKEFAAGHITGSINVPGGQAVQRADDFVAVRNAPIIFISNAEARAVMAAYWYRQMGFKDVSVLHGGLEAWQAGARPVVAGAETLEPLGFDAAKRAARFVDAAQLKPLIEQRAVLLLDVSTSLEYETAHIPGARWLSRGWIDIKLPELIGDRASRMVVTCSDGRQSTLAAWQLAQLGYADVAVLDGGMRTWRAAGLQTQSGLTECLTPANDVVLSPSIRGSKDDMLNYLNWELKLQH